MPMSVKWSVVAAIALLIIVALYLMAVRGQALLLDLAAGVSAFICM